MSIDRSKLENEIHEWRVEYSEVYKKHILLHISRERHISKNGISRPWGLLCEDIRGIWVCHECHMTAPKELGWAADLMQCMRNI